jgi:hypothetical protein
MPLPGLSAVESWKKLMIMSARWSAAPEHFRLRRSTNSKSGRVGNASALPSDFKVLGRPFFRKDRYPEASVERGENTCRTRALKVRLTSRAALVKLPESQMATKLRKRTVS